MQICISPAAANQPVREPIESSFFLKTVEKMLTAFVKSNAF